MEALGDGEAFGGSWPAFRIWPGSATLQKVDSGSNRERA